MEVKIVIDVDDTICTNVRRLSYSACEPKKDVIRTINYLHDTLGLKIVFYTSRGMVSCGGDIEKIIKKNKAVLEDWLEANNVHYDEIVFGKPIGDLYVDDKAMNVTDFRPETFYRLKTGGSGKDIYRLGNIVKKDCGEDAERLKDWIEDNGGVCKYPKVLSYLYNEASMEYIEGENLCNSFYRSDLYDLLSLIERFSQMKKQSFDITPHIAILRKNVSPDPEFNRILGICENAIKNIGNSFVENASYCHGDLILSNVIKGKDGLYLIDPQYYREASSYILDLGKLRMSLMNYEKRFGISDADNSWLLGEFDEIIRNRGMYKEVLATNLMYVCRLYRYKTDKEAVKEMAKEILNGTEGVF